MAYGFQYIPRDDEPERFEGRSGGGRPHAHRLDWRAVAVSESIAELYRDIANVRVATAELPAPTGARSRREVNAVD